MVQTIKYPSGRWGLVGKVPFNLAYVNEDGSPATPEQVATATHCGPGFARPKLKALTFATQEEAEAALKVLA